MSKVVFSSGSQDYCYHGDIIYFAKSGSRIIKSYNIINMNNTIANIATTHTQLCITITDDGDTLFINGGWDGGLLSTTNILNISTLIWDSITIPNMNKSMFIFITLSSYTSPMNILNI